MISISPPVIAATRLKEDSSQVILRNIPASAIRSYRKQEEFRYLPARPVTTSLWVRIMEGINHWLSGKNLVLQFIQYAVLALVAGIFLFGILRMAGMNPIRLFSRTADQGGYGIQQVNDQLPDLEKEIRVLVKNHQFRQAIRLMFLQVLRQLDNRGLIRLGDHKTNQHYCLELRDSPLAGPFALLCRQFESAWYGQLPVDRSEFEKVTAQYQLLHEKIG